MVAERVNITKVYKRCLSGKSSDIITARTVYNYCISPFMVYCNKFGPEEKRDPENEFNNLMFEQGRAHEKNVIERTFSGLKPVQYATNEQGFRLLLEAMSEGVSVMAGMPVFYMPKGMAGIVDVLEKRSGQRSVFGNYHYVIKEIKLAKNIRREHVFQASFYNYILGKIQGYTPPTFYLINRDFEEIEQKFDEPALLAIIRDIRRIFHGKKVRPTLGACIWPWETYNDEEAIKSRDVSLVSGVGRSCKRRLTARNIRTVERLAKTPVAQLAAIEGIGERTAIRFHNNAVALASGKHIQLGFCEFPEKKTEMFLDLEGTGEQMQDQGLVAMDYLIGLLVRRDGKEKYIPFVAHKLDGEKEMFTEFLNYVRRQDDFMIYHWHNYERTHIQRLIDRYGSSAETESIVQNMRDLYKDAIANFAFPTYGNGLKEIAAYIGYKWKRVEVNAMESIALYFQFIQDPVANKDKLEKIIDYNRDDVVATRLIKDWLQSQSKI